MIQYLFLFFLILGGVCFLFTDEVLKFLGFERIRKEYEGDWYIKGFNTVCEEDEEIKDRNECTRSAGALIHESGLPFVMNQAIIDHHVGPRCYQLDNSRALYWNDGDIPRTNPINVSQAVCRQN